MTELTTKTLRRHWKLWTDKLNAQTRPIPTSIRELGMALDKLEAAEELIANAKRTGSWK